MKIWMSENTKYKNKYALRLILSILAIVLISMIGLIALTFLSMEMNLPIQIISVVLTVLITGLIILLALRLGRKNQKDILIFVQDHQKRMYVINAMNYIHVSNELTALIQSAVQTERHLNQLKKTFYYAESDLNLNLEGIVPQIVSVLNMKEDKNGYYLVCRMLSIHGQLYKQTYPVYHGYENEEELIYALRKLMDRKSQVEIRVNTNPYKIAVCGIFTLIFLLLCLLSHPLTAVLSETLYFPCLGLTFVFFSLTMYFIVKQKRGE